MTYEARIDGHNARIAIEAGRLRYESDSVVDAAFEMQAMNSGYYSILIEGRSYTAITIPGGGVAVNGRVYDHVEIVDPRAYRSRDTGGQVGGRQSIAALMPGRVIRVLVETGQQVESGQGLIVVEAMKMQNEVKAPASGKVIEVRFGAGDAVVAGQILVVIE